MKRNWNPGAPTVLQTTLAEERQHGRLQGALARPESQEPKGVHTCERCGRRRMARPRSKLCLDCLYAASGPLPLEVDEPTPCHFSSPTGAEFLALEAEIEEAVAEPGVAASSAQLASIARYVEKKAEPFCGECPLVGECLARVRGGQYTGVAGGRLLINGRVRAKRDWRGAAA